MTLSQQRTDANWDGCMEIQNSEFKIPNSSDGVWYIDELDIESVVVGDPAAKGADAEALRRIVARGDIMDAVLGSLMHDPLGRFAGHISIEPGGHRLVELALSAAGHDAHRRHQPIASREDLGLAIASLADGCKEFIRLDSLGEDPTHPGRGATMHSEGFELFKPEATGQLGGIAEFEMSIQRQVVGNQ